MRGRAGFVWVAVIVNAGFSLWLFAGAFMRALRGCESYAGEARVLCESHNGGTPASVVLAWWLLADLVLLAVGFEVRRRTPGQTWRTPRPAPPAGVHLLHEDPNAHLYWCQDCDFSSDEKLPAKLHGYIKEPRGQPSPGTATSDRPPRVDLPGDDGA